MTAVDDDAGAWLEIARLGRVRGLRGELFAAGSQPPEWYTALAGVRIKLAGGGWFGAQPEQDAAEVRISAARLYSGRLALCFAGIDSAEAAAPLVNATVFVSRGARPPAPAGEIWLSDLVGWRVEEARSGREIGRVTGWQEFDSPFVTLEVTPGGGGDALLVPYVKAICVEVDPAARRIRIDPPEGLLDLNARPAKDGPAGDRQRGGVGEAPAERE
ncbi:MAG: ribosome maturation factor RimM [Bryobacteraceae bacterium]